MPQIYWLRYCYDRKTGFAIRFKTFQIGLRWSRKVFGATAGPWFHHYKSGILLDARLLSIFRRLI